MKRVGIVGKGQLGRMMALAGYARGMSFGFLEGDTLKDVVFTQSLESASEKPVLMGLDALQAFILWADVITFENENVNPDILSLIVDSKTPHYPNQSALLTTSDRLDEKKFLTSLNIPTAPFYPVSTRAELYQAAEKLGYPFLLKTRRFGYDGKGQYRLNKKSDLDELLFEDNTAYLAEGMVHFNRELSIIAARNVSAETVFYPMGENVHIDGILRTCKIDRTRISASLQKQAQEMINTIMDKLQYVGVLTIELFCLPDESLLVNELAPRVHNSGHWTIEGAECSQFENHVRAVLNWPLGATSQRFAYNGMLNVIGQHPRSESRCAQIGTYWHDYAKAARPGRKLGHVTLVSDSLKDLDIKMNHANNMLVSE